MKKLILILTVFACNQLMAADKVEVVEGNRAQDKELNVTAESQRALKDPNERKNYLNTSNAQQANANVEALTKGNSEHKEDVYNLAAEILPWLMEESKGDPVKAQALLNESQTNPKAFYQRLPAAQRERIKALAEKMEAAQKPADDKDKKP